MAIGTALAVAGLATSAASAISSGVAAGKSRRAARDQANAIANYQRQEIIDPYAGVKDLSSMVTNPFANLQVATKAAEMQAEEADISLASTLDTLRATGAGSAGATALAQAALKSKQGIAATIEQQEAQNARLRAQGEQQAQQARMSEAQRLQQADVAGKQFMFQTKEQREMQELNRMAGLQQQYQATAQAQQGAMYGALGSFAGQAVGLGMESGAFGGRTPQVNTVNSITPTRNVMPVGTGISAPVFTG